MKGGVDLGGHVNYPLDLVKDFARLDFVGVQIPVGSNNEWDMDLGEELDEFFELGGVGSS